MAFNAARIWLSRRLTIDRRAFEIMMRGFAREGRRRCHKHHDHDRDQRSHSILTSSAGFPLGHPGRDKFNN
jgi:hypothetical protein